MRRLCIKFGDNDFYCTWISVLAALEHMMREQGTDILDHKKALIDVLNKLSYPHYVLTHHRWELEGEHVHYSEEIDQSTLLWLKLSDRHVLIDSEVDEFLDSDPFYNGEFFFLDIDEHTGYSNVYSL